MNLSLLRHHRRKDWKKVYVDKVDHIKEEALVHADKYAHVNDGDNPAAVNLAAGFILAVMNDRLDRDMSVNSRLNAGTSINNLHPPSDPARWATSWGTQAMCLLCGLRGISDCRICENCDNIAHKQCINYEYCQSEPDLGSQQYYNRDEFVCPDCMQSKQLNEDHFSKVKAKLLRDKVRLRAAKRIGKFMIVLCGSRFLQRRRRAVLRLQSVVRGFLIYSKYRSYLKAKMKLLILEIAKLPTLVIENGVVVLTVFDTFKHVQTMRIEKTAEEALKEGFFIPGINAKMTIVFNLARQIDLGRDTADNSGRKYYLLYSQAELSLKDIANFTRNKKISLNFSEKIKWLPSTAEITAGVTCKYALILGPPALPGGGSSEASSPPAKDSSTAIVSGSTTSGDAPSSPQATNSFSHVSGGVLAKRLLGPDRQCIIRYLYQNPVLTIVGKVQGPPLDILKRPPEAGIKKSKPGGVGGNNVGNSGSGNSRNSRYWICLYRLRLLLFQFYGDIYPRFVSDVSAATAVLVRDKKGRPTSFVSIVHSDSRMWTIDFGSVRDALSFEFALNESKKANSEAGSMYHPKTGSFMVDLQFGFSIQNTY